MAEKFVGVAEIENKDDIAVEIIDVSLTRQKYISLNVGEDREDLCQVWPAVMTNVHKILQSEKATKDRATTIALFRFGYNEGADQNPKTVYISVNYESPENAWPDIVARIQEYLDTLGLGLVAHLEYELHTNSNLEVDYTQQSPNPRQDSLCGAALEFYNTDESISDVGSSHGRSSRHGTLREARDPSMGHQEELWFGDNTGDRVTFELDYSWSTAFASTQNKEAFVGTKTCSLRASALRIRTSL
ncbi:hypothetical protein OQA88_61 [Cercophora sp. LCS_1]